MLKTRKKTLENRRYATFIISIIFSSSIHASLARTTAVEPAQQPGAATQIETQATVITPSDARTTLLPLDKSAYENASKFTIGRESVQIGGLYTSKKTPVHRSLSVIGQPFGNYNAGCTLCIFSTSSGSFGGGGQAAIDGLDYRAGASAVSRGGFDVVGFYHYDENYPARVTAQVKEFSKGLATLVNPMTAEQMATLHQGMYVVTNVVEPQISTSVKGLVRVHAYAGFLKKWDATHLWVYDWAVPGAGNSKSGQIPDASNLDQSMSTYKYPVAWVGAPTKHFAENSYMAADGSRVIGDKATSVANAFEREEFDFRASNWSLPHSFQYHGWTTSFQCDNCVNNAVDDDSYGYLVNGPGLPTAFKAQVYGDGIEYQGNNAWIGGNGAPEVVLADDKTSSAPAQVPVGTNHILAGFSSRLPSGDNLNLYSVIERVQKTDGGWSDYGLRFGMARNGERDRRRGLIGAEALGSILFNKPGHQGGVCIDGNVNSSGLCVDGDGTLNFYGDGHFEKNVSLASDRGIAFSTTASSGDRQQVLQMCDDQTLCLKDANSKVRSFLSKQVEGGTVEARSLWIADGHGNWIAGSKVATGGAVAEASYTFATLPTNAMPDGAHVWCADCRLNGVTGVEAYWHTQGNVWTNAVNQQLAK